MTTTLDPTSIDPKTIDDEAIGKLAEESGITFDPSIPSEPRPEDWPRSYLDGDKDEELSVHMRDPFDSEADLSALPASPGEDAPDKRD